MDVTLRQISADNWQECLNLRVYEEQQSFAPPNVYALARAYVFPECVPLAIYVGETMVGFLMYEFDTTDHIPWILHFMIDQAHQGNGYGRAAFQELILRVEAQSERSEIRVSIAPDNAVGERVYRRMGFDYTGELREGAQVMRLQLQ
jgi:diamine N-acetyltransferase